MTNLSHTAYSVGGKKKRTLVFFSSALLHEHSQKGHFHDDSVPSPRERTYLELYHHQPNISVNATHLRSRTASPAFFKAGPLVLHRSSHVSKVIFVSEPRPIALRKLSGVEISPAKKVRKERPCRRQNANTSWRRHRFKECAVLKCATR